MAEAPSFEKEPLTSSVMYLDRVRSEMVQKIEIVCWELEYNSIKYDQSYIRQDSSMGFLHFTKRRDYVMVILCLNFSCKTSVGCFLVYELQTDGYLCSETISAEHMGGRKHMIVVPNAWIEDKSNKHLRKSGCIVMGFRYYSRRLLNTEVGIYLIRSDKTDNFLEAYRKQLFTDFIIRAGGQEFHVHKAILSARSIYFLENVPSTKSEITLDTTTTAVQNVVHFLYSGELPTVTLDEMIDVYEVSVILHIRSLLDLCVVYFLDILNDENVGKIKDTALKTGNGLLIKAINQR